jgi:UDP-N-acetylglucosamine 2-epimerase
MKLFTIIGTRPQFIKACLLSKELKERSIEEVIVHTGQHYDKEMSDIFFEKLNMIKPKYHLDIKEKYHGAMTGKMIIELEQLIIKETPTHVMVYGDCNTTLAGAIVARKLNIPIIHVESGLRSFDKKMPEEINRVLTDHISTYLMCPTLNSIENLKKESIVQNVFLTGDLMVELLRQNIELVKTSSFYNTLNVKPKQYYLATIHRQSNTTPRKIKEILSLFNKQKFPVLFCMHPRTLKVIENNNIQIPENVIYNKPVGFLEILNLLYNSRALFTDSGGLQKESYVLKIPCFTLRKNTEWKELIFSGWNVLGFPENIEGSVEKMLQHNHPELYMKNTSTLIVNILQEIIYKENA